ncbi:MAG: hypothetical protein RJA38_1068, partial [Bacteroidota bacterium]
INDFGRFLKSFQNGFNHIVRKASNGKGFGGE